jgi:2-polyprenyl-6-hydroxyphenyl methylase / 3-demethylubiquinone-9 3-methyltransferase
MAHASQTAQTLDRDEVARFARLAGDWWDERGPFRQLHRINPVRLTYIRDQLCQKFGRDAKQAASLAGLSVLDIGCGGGLVCEPLARLGADVTGIDPAAENIAAAKAHASAAGLHIAYEVATAEELAARVQCYDAVLLLEVVEHVPDVPAFVKTVAPLVKPGGVMILSTLNRTLKAYALAIIGAEFILRWLPVGTHQWQRFVTPEELRASLSAAGLSLVGAEGLIYDPFADEWRLDSDTDINYFVTAMRR